MKRKSGIRLSALRKKLMSEIGKERARKGEIKRDSDGQFTSKNTSGIKIKGVKPVVNKGVADKFDKTLIKGLSNKNASKRDSFVKELTSKVDGITNLDKKQQIKKYIKETLERNLNKPNPSEEVKKIATPKKDKQTISSYLKNTGKVKLYDKEAKGWDIQKVKEPIKKENSSESIKKKREELKNDIDKLVESSKNANLEEKKAIDIEISKKRVLAVALFKEQQELSKKELEIKEKKATDSTSNIQTKYKDINEGSDNEVEKDKKIRKMISDELKATYEPPKKERTHGMPDEENMWSVKYNGIEFHDGDDLEKSRIVDIIKEMNEKKLPMELVKQTKNIYLSKQRNKKDAYWAEKYNRPGEVSAATGGDGDVVTYGINKVKYSTLTHEMGHNLALAKYGTSKPPEDSDYEKASKEGDHISLYGQVNLAEDFAETVSYMFSDIKFAKGKSGDLSQIADRIKEVNRLLGIK